MADKGDQIQNLRLKVWDYAVLVTVIALASLIGMYRVWRARRATNTRTFLAVDRRIGLVPLVLSMAATTLSPATMLGMPTETYSNGIQFYFVILAWVFGTLFAVYTVVPVMYELNVTTVNQYVEYRFNRLLRTVPAFLGLLQNSFFLASITYLTAMILTKATELHIWWSVLLVTGICIVYSSLGGISAVIWTDVFFFIVIFVTLAAMVVKGIMVTGGVSNIWEANVRGRRTIWAYFKPDPHSNYTIWSMVIGYFFISLSIVTTNQSELQRQQASKTLYGAQKMSMLTIITYSGMASSVFFIGLMIYAQYSECDPLLNGEVTTRDMLVVKFAGEMFANSPGMNGLYVAGILCTTLSTLSSVINAFAIVTLTDFIKPLMSNMADSTATLISKTTGILYGLLVISLTAVSQYLGGLVQTLQVITGLSIAPTAGILLLGVLFPWATAKGATLGYVTGFSIGLWMAVGRISAKAPYITAPMSTVGCNSSHHDSETNFYLAQVQTNFTEMTPSGYPISEKPETFFLYLVIPIWYCLIIITSVIIVGLITSFATGSEDLHKLNPKLISPLTKWMATLLPETLQRKSGLATILANDKKLAAHKNMTNGESIELETLNAGINGKM